MKRKLILTTFAVLLTTGLQAQTNHADRALWASIATTPSSGAIVTGDDYKAQLGKVLVNWRMLPGDDENTGFDLYRKIGTGTETQLNAKVSFTGGFHYEVTPILATNYQDNPSDKTKDITYRLTYTGDSVTIGTYTITANRLKNGLPYIEIPLQTTEQASELVNNHKYKANDCSVGDLDGDGVLEIVVKRLLTSYDNAGNQTGSAESASDTDPKARHIALFEAYKLDGTFMWRVMSGPNIIAGNSINFSVADIDGDGCCEVVTRTSEGTVFGDGYEIPDTDGDGITDYRSIWPTHYQGDSDKGYGGPEFFSVIDGKTGRELARANFIGRGPDGATPEELAANWYQNDWNWDPRTNKYTWKLANSLRIGVAHFQEGPGLQIFLGRGVYGRTIVEGWQYNGEGNEMTRLWRIDTMDKGGQDVNKDGKPFSAYAGQGNHAFNVADLDGDGLDEVMYGSCAWDNDGTGLWTTGLGHGDANHVGKFLPEREGLQMWHCLENGKTEVALHDARTGEIIWDIVSTADNDMGRCMVADVDPTSPGCEFWKYGNELYDQNGTPLYNDQGNRRTESSANAGIWFDGYLNRQMINEGIINSYTHGRTFTMYRYNVGFNNSTKSNPGWYGDMLGDWREEVICPDNTKLQCLRLFATWYPTAHRFPWLMTDHTYKMQTIHQQVGYNQPNNLGYYLGSDLTSDREAWEAGGYMSTGIVTVESDQNTVADNPYYYTLGGQRMTTPPAKGMYIYKGRKHLGK